MLSSLTTAYANARNRERTRKVNNAPVSILLVSNSRRIISEIRFSSSDSCKVWKNKRKTRCKEQSEFFSTFLKYSRLECETAFRTWTYPYQLLFDIIRRYIVLLDSSIREQHHAGSYLSIRDPSFCFIEKRNVIESFFNFTGVTNGGTTPAVNLVSNPYTLSLLHVSVMHIQRTKPPYLRCGTMLLQLPIRVPTNDSWQMLLKLQ